MKKIFSQFGQPALQKLSKQQNIQWIIPESARDNEVGNFLQHICTILIAL